MTILQAIALGIVEGLTEYLPVSSTGHLILVQRAMGIVGSESANAYAICIQAGAIAAVLGLYSGRVRQIVQGVIARGAEDEAGAGLRLGGNLTAALVPAVLFGLLFENVIEQHLFGLQAIVAAWLVGGLVILGVARWREREPIGRGRDLDELRWPSVLVIGLAQCVAMLPGTSRSLVTILGGLLVGLSVPAAVEFSFLLGMVTLAAAAGYKAVGAGPEMVEAYGWMNLVAGFVAAMLSAAAAVKWMVAYLTRHSLAVFGYYRVVLALAVVALLAMGAV